MQRIFDSIVSEARKIYLEQPQDEAMMASAAPQASAPPQGVL